MSTAAVRARRLRIALGINVIIVVLQVILGFGAHSIGLLADAAHNLTDVVGLSLAFAAVQISRRPATASRSFGWHRGPILAGQANAAMILALTAWILVEGGRRLADPPRVDGLPVLVVALVAFAANAGAAWVVHEPHDSSGAGHAPGRDLNMHGALLHLLGDAGASLGVALSGAVILATGGWYWLDPAVSILLGLTIGWHAAKLLRASNAILLEGAPEGLDPDELRDDMRGVAGVLDVHDLHVWAIGSRITALSAHVVVDGCETLAEARLVIDQLRDRLRDAHGITHSTLELEDDACGPEAADHCVLEPVAPPIAGHGHHH